MTPTASWTGTSGQDYVFELYPLGTEFNPVSAVYILCKSVVVSLGGPIQYEALYVGETQSLHDRLNSGLVQHDGLKRATKAGATHVGVLRLDGTAQRAAVETDLRHRLNPVCNDEENALLNALLRR